MEVIAEKKTEKKPVVDEGFEMGVEIRVTEIGVKTVV